MALIRKYLAKKNYTNVDNNVTLISKSELSDGACRLYMYLASFQNGRRITDSYILKVLDMGESSLKKYKAQLRKLDLIVVYKIVGKEYDMYIGSTQIPASKVKEYWDELDSPNTGKPIDLEELMKIRELSTDESNQYLY